MIAEWRAKGLLEGQLETMRATLLRALQVRFQVPPPSEVAAGVEALTKGKELSRLFDLALTAASLADFRAGLEQEPPLQGTD